MIGHRRKLFGVVISDKMQKSVVVDVERRYKHPVFKKFITNHKKVLAHDEKNECHIGDRVSILEVRPLSKRKRWQVLEILEKAK